MTTLYNPAVNRRASIPDLFTNDSVFTGLDVQRPPYTALPHNTPNDGYLFSKNDTENYNSHGLYPLNEISDFPDIMNSGQASVDASGLPSAMLSEGLSDDFAKDFSQLDSSPF